MKKSFVVLALAAAVWLPLASTAKPVLSITPATQVAAVGDTVLVDVYVTGLKAIGEIVSAFDLNVLFAPTLLNGAGAGFYAVPFGGNASIDTSTSFGAGNSGAILNSFLADNGLALLQTNDPFKLLTLTFMALANGAAFLNFGPDSDFERALIGRNAQLLDLDYVGACVAIGANADCRQTVPEPASYALVLVALLAGIKAARRAKPAAPAVVF